MNWSSTVQSGMEHILRIVEAKFHYAIWSQTGPKLVADLQRAEFGLSSSSLAASWHELAGLRPASDLSATRQRNRIWL